MKSLRQIDVCCHYRSLPTRERELKSFLTVDATSITESLPTREREFKPYYGTFWGAMITRSPFRSETNYPSAKAEGWFI